MNQPISVLIADDHPLVRESLVTVVNAEEDFEVVGEAASGADAVRLAHELRPDLLILDLVMPGEGGLDVLREIQGQLDQLRVLVLTGWADESKLRAALRAGARGVLLKGVALPQLLDAIRGIVRGDYIRPSVVARQIIDGTRRSSTAGTSAEPLTSREAKILGLVAKGLSNNEIAEYLDLSNHTVANHVRNVLSKLGVENRTQAVVFARDHGLI